MFVREDGIKKIRNSFPEKSPFLLNILKSVRGEGEVDMKLNQPLFGPFFMKHGPLNNHLPTN